MALTLQPFADMPHEEQTLIVRRILAQTHGRFSNLRSVEDLYDMITLAFRDREHFASPSDRSILRTFLEARPT